MDSSKWNFEENKAFEGVIATFPEDFEEAMAMFPDDLPDRWKTKTAEIIEGKNQSEVCNHFRAPYEDLQAIYTGKVELPAYKDDLHLPEKKVRGRKPGSKNRPKPIVLEPKIERKKIRQWTENEHR
ncbi:hypothetical protein AMTR_s00022p00113590 [Amborella trichopoda]|uniref:Myb-like domain-containing protein n=1 Tax=Amborella trichopoda TaxID=13333 RepID=W1PTW8_AMBTC|nr:hypothetical protein AMTR_s00022p00113590 [Amborella trichopoda]